MTFARTRASLLAVSEHWQELGLEANGWPITFNEEIENQGYFERLVDEFQVNSILPDDGVVGPEGYETLQMTSGTEGKICVVGRKRGPESLDKQRLALSG
jgi:hypothetical protein